MSRKHVEFLGPEWDLQPIEAKKPRPEDTPIWDGKTALNYVGKEIPRIDGPEKVTGTAKYTTDIQLDGMLYACVIRAPLPSGRIKRIRMEEVLKAPGVMAVHEVATTGATLRYEGQPLAAIAATSLRLAERAAELADIEIETLPHASNVEAAMAPEAPLVYKTTSTAPGKGKLPIQGNLRGPATGGRRFKSTGDVTPALEASDLIVEESFDTAVQTHSCLEPHGSVVEPLENGGMNIWTSTQSIMSVVRDVARAFDIPRSQVHVMAQFVGGGFGSKFGAGQHTIMAAHLARKTKAPVQLILNRREEHLCGGNRPSSRQSIKMGWNSDGILQAWSFTSHGSAGVGTGAGAAAPFHMMYKCNHRHSLEYDVFTNTGAAAAFRAPGHPQGVFALEGMVDLAAKKLDIDPIELRLKNDGHPVRREQWRRAVTSFDWNRKRKELPGEDEDGVVRGVGAASSIWYNIMQKRVGATVELYNTGQVRVLTGVQDIGVGIRTVVAQVAADALQIPMERIEVVLGDSHLPEGPGSGGSKTTASLTPAIHEAAHKALRKLAHIASPFLGVHPDKVVFRNGYATDVEETSRMPFLELCRNMSFEKLVGHGERQMDRDGILNSPVEEMVQLGKVIAGIQMAQVAVDTYTGIIRVEEVLAIQDCGRVMNPLQARSQVNGGVIQGVSYALYEERRLDPKTGIMLNGNLEKYRIAGVGDLPNIQVQLTNTYSGRTSTGAMGLGEPATVPTAAAIRNAVYHATGAFLTSLPMTPKKVLSALKGVI